MGITISCNSKRQGLQCVLPIQTPSYFISIIGNNVPTLVDSQATVTKYVRQYWERAFEISSHKLRLSHFIVGNPFQVKEDMLFIGIFGYSCLV